MVYLEIKPSSSVDTLNEYLKKPGAHVFVLFYMEGCGPCNATRPEWAKLKNVLSNDFLKRDDVAVVAIDQVLAPKLENIGGEPNSFPTMRYIGNAGKTVENYEDAEVPQEKDRTIDSFVAWIQAKTGAQGITTTTSAKGGGKSKRRRYKHKSSSNKHRRRPRTTKRTWSASYKRRISCKRPRGFSQRQYCKYRR